MLAHEIGFHRTSQQGNHTKHAEVRRLWRTGGGVAAPRRAPYYLVSSSITLDYLTPKLRPHPWNVVYGAVVSVPETPVNRESRLCVLRNTTSGVPAAPQRRSRNESPPVQRLDGRQFPVRCSCSTRQLSSGSASPRLLCQSIQKLSQPLDRVTVNPRPSSNRPYPRRIRRVVSSRLCVINTRRVRPRIVAPRIQRHCQRDGLRTVRRQRQLGLPHLPQSC